MIDEAGMLAGNGYFICKSRGLWIVALSLA